MKALESLTLNSYFVVINEIAQCVHGLFPDSSLKPMFNTVLNKHNGRSSGRRSSDPIVLQCGINTHVVRLHRKIIGRTISSLPKFIQRSVVQKPDNANPSVIVILQPS